jgi:hypothetical protein
MAEILSATISTIRIEAPQIPAMVDLQFKWRRLWGVAN